LIVKKKDQKIAAFGSSYRVAYFVGMGVVGLHRHWVVYFGDVVLSGWACSMQRFV
jgi:hypothetical protein